MLDVSDIVAILSSLYETISVKNENLPLYELVKSPFFILPLKSLPVQTSALARHQFSLELILISLVILKLNNVSWYLKGPMTSPSSQ